MKRNFFLQICVYKILFCVVYGVLFRRKNWREREGKMNEKHKILYNMHFKRKNTKERKTERKKKEKKRKMKLKKGKI